MSRYHERRGPRKEHLALSRLLRSENSLYVLEVSHSGVYDEKSEIILLSVNCTSRVN